MASYDPPRPFSSTGLPADIELDSDGWPDTTPTEDELMAMEADYLADLAQVELDDLKRKPAA